MIWRISSELGGLLIVLFTLRDVFRDLFHPTSSGSLSGWIAQAAALAKHLRPGLRATVGPLALVGVIFTWVTLITLGFALIYLGAYSAIEAPGRPREGSVARLLHSVYLSLGSLVTFQTFDLDPNRNWIRLVIAIEGLIGSAVITASISWTVLLYPALARARWLMERIDVYDKGTQRPGFGAEIDSAILAEFARSLIQVRIDLRISPILLAFYLAEQSATLAAKLPLLVDLAARGRHDSERSDVRRAAVQLEIALDRFAEVIEELALRDTQSGLTREKIFQRFARIA